MKRIFVFAVLICCWPCLFWAQTKSGWRAATPRELESFLPARAPVNKERIETELRTASGIIDDRGHIIASVVLITAGYSAEGKYSHYLLTQRPLILEGRLSLPPGAYVVGWTRGTDGLAVHIFEAATVKDLGTVVARPIPYPRRVESFRIWPPDDQHYIQIGRYMLPYSIGI
jgi:hypothetical protein